MTKTIDAKSVTEEFEQSIKGTESVRKVVELGVNLFSIRYIETIHKMCWPIFRARMDRLAPKDPGDRKSVV
jgi:hypothetical protein